MQDNNFNGGGQFRPEKIGGYYDSRGYYVFPDGSYYDAFDQYHPVNNQSGDNPYTNQNQNYNYNYGNYQNYNSYGYSNQNPDQNNESENQKEDNHDSTYAFDWENTDECGPDKSSEPEPIEMFSKKKNSGLKITLAIMGGVFGLALLLLLVSLVFGLFETGDNAFKDRPVVNVTFSDKGATSPSDSDASADTLENTKKAVVVITVTKSTGASGMGSGFIITDNGYIVTNQHVVESAADITVELYDGRVYYNAEVVGESESDDIAVIKISETDLPFLTLFDNSNCYVGERVYAIGCPDGYELSWTVTMGIISHTGRDIKIYDNSGNVDKIMHLIQTDVAVNHGNSGGPLVNIRGEVVGIVTMKISENDGLGFAIPINSAYEIIEVLIEKGHTDDITSSVSNKRGMLGLSCVAVTKGNYYAKTSTGIEPITSDEAETEMREVIFAEESGIYVMSVDNRYNAKGVMQKGDIITKVNGRTVHSNPQMSSIIDKYRPNDTLSVEFFRDGQILTKEILLLEER